MARTGVSEVTLPFLPIHGNLFARPSRHLPESEVSQRVILANGGVLVEKFVTPAEIGSRAAQFQPASTLNSCAVHIAPSSDARNSAIRATSAA